MASSHQTAVCHNIIVAPSVVKNGLSLSMSFEALTPGTYFSGLNVIKTLNVNITVDKHQSDREALPPGPTVDELVFGDTIPAKSESLTQLSFLMPVLQTIPIEPSSSSQPVQMHCQESEQPGHQYPCDKSLSPRLQAPSPVLPSTPIQLSPVQLQTQYDSPTDYEHYLKEGRPSPATSSHADKPQTDPGQDYVPKWAQDFMNKDMPSQPTVLQSQFFKHKAVGPTRSNSSKKRKSLVPTTDHT
ncbi:hypothetical protein EDD85DRAFT_797223 [Armillaria nabsnona]|nr:hypothetical protein EDD85DRAFT_797223 [Armillaria nabsnona]